MDGYMIMWLVLLAAFLVLEICTVAVVCIWFALGAMAAAICNLLGGNLVLQVIVFVVVSLASLFLLRTLTHKRLQSGKSATNVDALIGMPGLVIEEIHNIEARGRVKLGSMEWSARSTTGDTIPEGTLVVVDKIEGVKVIVTPIPMKTKEEIL